MGNSDEEDLSKEERRKLRKEKKKKKKSPKKESVAAEPNSDGDNDESNDANKTAREDRKRKRKDLMDKVPKVDADGISYTKIQLRRMRKRVARGLDPIETEAEKQERFRNEKALRKEEEAELAGLVYQKKPEQQSNDEDEENDKDDDGDNSEANASDDDEKEDHDKSPSKPSSSKSKSSTTNPSPSKKPRSAKKAVPADYVCQACQNKTQPAHWIYDCPRKVHRPGTNQVSKKFRGVLAPDRRKIFLSGLPFQSKAKDIAALLKGCTVTQCKLLKFADTGRCKGQALVALETEEQADIALALDGTLIDNIANDENPDVKAPSKAKLKLKVSRVKSRAETKRSQ